VAQQAIDTDRDLTNAASFHHRQQFEELGRKSSARREERERRESRASRGRSGRVRPSSQLSYREPDGRLRATADRRDRRRCRRLSPETGLSSTLSITSADERVRRVGTDVKFAPIRDLSARNYPTTRLFVHSGDIKRAVLCRHRRASSHPAHNARLGRWPFQALCSFPTGRRPNFAARAAYVVRCSTCAVQRLARIGRRQQVAFGLPAAPLGSDSKGPPA